MSNKLDFESYLQSKFAEEEPAVLDDDMPDAFDHWLSGLDVAEVMEYAQEAIDTLQ